MLTNISFVSGFPVMKLLCSDVGRPMRMSFHGFTTLITESSADIHQTYSVGLTSLSQVRSVVGDTSTAARMEARSAIRLAQSRQPPHTRQPGRRGAPQQ